MGSFTNVSLPRLFELDELQVLHTLKSSKNEEIGILVASESKSKNATYKPIIRLYLLRKDNGNFEVIKEIDALTFQTQEDANKFAEQLPSMSAADFLLSINQVKL